MAILIRSLRPLVSLAVILATALALMMAAAAVPARADDDDLVRALAAIAVVGLIAKTLDDNDGDRRRDRRDRRGDDRRDELPASCAVDLRNRRADVVYAEPCLRNAGVDRRLPGYCARDVRVRGRYVTVYPQRCLLDEGFRIERRRR